MNAFLDTGFLLTLLFETSGSRLAWQLARGIDGPLYVAHLQIFVAENRLFRESRNRGATDQQRGVASAALQRLARYSDELVFQAASLDYDIAFNLATQWQRNSSHGLLAGLLLLWPAIAVTISATHFFSFDPRTRRFAKAAGLKLIPENL